MKFYLNIIKYKFLIFIRLNTKLDLASVLKNIGSSIIYIGFGIGAFLFSQKLIWFLLTQIKVGLFLLHQFISIILFIFFISVNVGNIIVSYSTLYKSNEVNFLFTKPVDHTKIFVIKFLDNFFYSSTTLVLILLSVMAGYAVYFNLDFINVIILFLFGFVPFILSAGSLGVIILLIMIRLAVKVGLKRIVYSVGTLYILALILFFRINSPVELVNSVMKFYPIIDKDQYLSNLIPSHIKFLPNNWLAESSFWMLKNDYSNSIPLIITQCIISIILFSIALKLGKKWYFKTWLTNIQLIADYSLKRKNKFSFFNFERNSFFQSLTESFFKRDFFMFIREPSQVIHFSVLFFLILLFMLSVSGIHYIGLGNIFLQTGIFLAVLLFNLLLISTLSLRFIFPLISLEGESFWLIKSAPVNSALIIQKKYQFFGTIILIISFGLAYFSFYRFEFIIELNTILITLVSAITIITINLGMGGLFSNFKEKNAIRLSSSQGASIAFLINIFYMLFIVSILFIPLSNYFLSRMIGGHFNYYSLFNYTAPLLFISAILIHFFYKAAKKSLEKDF